MNRPKKHAFPGYDKISAQLENASHIYKNFSAAYCQTLLETAESYAQAAQSVQGLKTTVMELIGYLNALPYRNKAEREARAALLERAEKVLKNDQNDTGATGGIQAAE